MATAKKTPVLETSDLPVAYMNVFVNTANGGHAKIGMITLDPNDSYKLENDQVQIVKNVRSLIEQIQSNNLFGIFRQGEKLSYVVNRAGGNPESEEAEFTL